MSTDDTGARADTFPCAGVSQPKFLPACEEMRGDAHAAATVAQRAGRGRWLLSVPLLLVVLLAGCGQADEATLFTSIEARESGVDFENTVAFQEDFNIIEYLYFYDGGGVALGDINRDGLQDIFLTGNQVSNRLFVNQGSLRFEDRTIGAGLASSGWSTGATMADVNGDGWLDIYVCQVSYKSQSGRNLLYINRRDGTFAESAQAYGIAFEGLSTQAAFFDYDRDGDLDLYLLNHAVHSSESFVPAWRRTVDAPRVGDLLFRNDGGTHFTNVTADAGIYSSALGYGLGLAVSDLNDDGWLDIYVGNDFHENDYLYLNQRDGTFEEVLQRVIGHTSQSTMGVDIADFNNDAWPDVVALDMMPADWGTYLASGGPDEAGVARIKRNHGYAPQVSRNTLQLHRGLDAEGYPLFFEIGAFLGIHATDWSWTPLLADLDGDGWKDLFVTNGIGARPNDLDYVDYVAQPAVQRILDSGHPSEVERVTRHMPQVAIGNYAFRNRKGQAFDDATDAWGLDAPSVSNGASYGDLDNDGDLDLVVNNINQAASLYRNNSDSPRFLRVSLEGAGLNTTAVGARVTVFAEGAAQTQEQMPTRGFQSSVPHVLTFGLGQSLLIDSVAVRWPGGTAETFYGIAPNHHIVLQQRAEAKPWVPERAQSTALLAELPGALSWMHQENDYEDFDYEPLIPHRLSTQGPALAAADVDGDGQDDVFLGGAHGQPALLLLGGMHPLAQSDFDADGEDVDAAFFDADGDRDADLYVVRGGSEQDTRLWQDVLYINDGQGNFVQSNGLPPFLANGCCVSATDYDLDGDTDLFVGTRSVPGDYGARPSSFLLSNRGDGRFTDVTTDAAPALLDAGMITGSAWADVTGDPALDLVLVGEWLPVTVLENRGGVLVETTRALGLDETGGWWQSVLTGDFDGDGDTDIVAGNLGLNSVLNAPIDLYVDDFDSDGSSDPLIVLGATAQFWARRDALLDHLPALSARLPSYARYASARAHEVVNLTAASHYRVHTFASLYLENDATFSARSLPDALQWAPVMDMISRDFDGDGTLDILAVGNFFGASTAQGPYDASHGTLLLGAGNGQFVVQHTGLGIRGDARRVRMVHTSAHGNAVVVAHSGGRPQVFQLRPK